MAAMLPPSTLTVVVPLSKSLDIEMMTGYGIGTGPPGLGVLHTSGGVFLQCDCSLCEPGSCRRR